MQQHRQQDRLINRKGHGTKRGVVVRVRNGNIDGALKEMKKRLKKDNFFIEMRRREYYMKPSEIKKLKKRRRKSVDGDNFE